MKIKLRAEGFTLKEGLKAALDKKLAVIDELFPVETVYDVFIKTTSNEGYKCEIKVQNGRDFIRSEAEGQRIEYAVNNAIKVLKKRIYKLKTIKIDKKRKHFAEDVVLDVDLDTAATSDNTIKRVKHVDAISMTENEAIIELESLNHSFYAFRDADNDDILSVLYRREDSGYGLLVIE